MNVNPDKNIVSLFKDKISEMKLPLSLEENLHNIYLPVCRHILNLPTDSSCTKIIGISGAQGSGKTTFTELLKFVLKSEFRQRVVSFSIDDFYLTRKEREDLSRNCHPLLKTRGVPGTHDVVVGKTMLEDLKFRKKTMPLKIPRFDKSMDDRYPQEKWQIVHEFPDIVLFEGWCVGAKPQPVTELKPDINTLEKQWDQSTNYRQFVNNALANDYQTWFALIDFQIMLKVPSFDKVFEWRSLQEAKLRENDHSMTLENKKIMPEEELKFFISHFERLTRYMLLEMPSRADVVIPINDHHQPESLLVKRGL